MRHRDPRSSSDVSAAPVAGRRLAFDLLLVALAYVAFLVSQGWLFLFASGMPWAVELLPCPLPSLDTVCVGGVRVPEGDVAAMGVGSAALRVTWNVGLFAIWGATHSVMARAWFKARWTKVVPEHLERCVYVLVAALGMSLVLAGWKPVASPALHFEGLLRALLLAVSLVGWGIATWATFLVDHLALFGIRPVLEHHGWLARKGDAFVQPAVYRWVRHPMMTGVLLILWVMPDVTAGRVLFALVGTAYVFIGTHFEERDLLRRFGQPYAEYRARTGRFFPSRGWKNSLPSPRLVSTPCPSLSNRTWPPAKRGFPPRSRRRSTSRGSVRSSSTPC